MQPEAVEGAGSKPVDGAAKEQMERLTVLVEETKHLKSENSEIKEAIEAAKLAIQSRIDRKNAENMTLTADNKELEDLKEELSELIEKRQQLKMRAKQEGNEAVAEELQELRAQRAGLVERMQMLAPREPPPRVQPGQDAKDSDED
eukprot:gb/GFBE01008846.1/.p1 GENE.gb/GFBE01008846.1/~~gb/GFBE01008846.1/.p1  ORF type:complete len:146 (+),score=57.04 gb/GFBE01008846.1/:1-438(+)